MTIDGVKIDKYENNFKYDFVLSSENSFYAPDIDDCFDVSRPDRINHCLTAEERERRKLGELGCIAIRQQTLAVAMSQPCIMVWTHIHGK